MKPSVNSTKAEAIATVDPVCGMEVVPGKTKLVTVHEGHSYWFCAKACRAAFEANPQKYLNPGPKGWLGRFLNRLAKANQGKFGRKGGHCCH